MAYEPTNWQAGDVVTSAKLNKLEQGVANGGGVLVVHEDENGSLDKTWQEIYDADFAVILRIGDGAKNIDPIDEIIMIDNNTYVVKYSGQTRSVVFSTSSPDDYPVYESNVGGGGK